MDELIIKMFNAYFKKEKLDDKLINQDFLRVIKEQSLLPYLYYVFNNPKFRQIYISAALYQETLNDFQKHLSQKLNNAAIDHLYVKGSVLNYLYDDNALRTRGDIDIYVDFKHIEEVKAILLKDNFKMENNICMHHIELSKGKINVEVHFSLLDPTEDTYYDFFKEPFKMATCINQHYYELNKEEHFLFCIVHFARHLRTGAGIRYILDFYYMLKKWQMDLDHLHSLIHKFKFDTLYENILNSIYLLTAEKLDIYKEKNVDFFISYLLKSGIHGFGKDNNFDEKNYAEKKHKIKHILLMVFIPKKQFRLALYPHLGKHLITYPLCLIHRIFYLLIHKSKSAFKFIFKKKNRSNKEKEDFYKKMGI